MNDRVNEIPWYKINNVEELSSPSLIIYPERVESNIRRMIEIAGGATSLRPHVKTHKMPEIVRLMMNYGIIKFKCATVAEAEMVAMCGGQDILLAMQPVGPNLDRYFSLIQKFPGTKFSCIVDCEEVIMLIWQKAYLLKTEVHLWLDINNGMNRTGIEPGEKAVLLYGTIDRLPLLNAEGLHVYDGHIHEKDPAERTRICNDSFMPVVEMVEKLKSKGFEKVNIVAGGTPTFPVHASRGGMETSPGTVLLMDYGYSSSFPDLEFMHAAILLTRVVSKPGGNLVCLDLGHKAVGSEMQQPRVMILDIGTYSVTGHNEEHMVISVPDADNIKIGDPYYCIPMHICPTVDRYDTVYVADDHRVTRQWDVQARKRKISI